MSALTEIEAVLVAEHGKAGAPRPGTVRRSRRPRGHVSARPAGRPVVVPGVVQPRSSSMTEVIAAAPVVVIPAREVAEPRHAAARPGEARPGAAQPAAARPGAARRSVPSASGPAPLRLTRRGRFVLWGLVVVAVTGAALLVSLLASGGAEATNHGKPGAGYQGMHQIVVQPGQTLWSIASAAEPSADPRSVIQQIMTVNDLTGTKLPVGEELWVPR